MQIFFRSSDIQEPSPIRLVPRSKAEGTMMSTWFGDDANPRLIAEAKQIAWEFLERSGEIDDPEEVDQFLIGKIERMIGQGQRNRLALSCDSRL